MGYVEEEALRVEVKRLQSLLAAAERREQARLEADRIALEATGTEVGGAAPVSLLYAMHDPYSDRTVRMYVGDKEVAAVLGPDDKNTRPGDVWDAIMRVVDSA